MGKYLDIARRFMAELEAKRDARVEPPSTPSLPPERTLPAEVASWPAERQEIWEERAAILEADAGLSHADAEREAVALCRPQPDGPQESLEVGEACPVCRRHLYVRREGHLWCDRCLRYGPP